MRWRKEQAPKEPPQTSMPRGTRIDEGKRDERRTQADVLATQSVAPSPLASAYRATGSGVGVPMEVTVLAPGSRMEGRLSVAGELRVLGVFCGEITALDGVYLEQGGKIEGRVCAPLVFIDGVLEGECISEDAQILTHGRLLGIYQGPSLSIERGGVFIGQSQGGLASEPDEACLQDEVAPWTDVPAPILLQGGSAGDGGWDDVNDVDDAKTLFEEDSQTR